jgi:imidazolonepropionase-like amidohydrolase
MRFGGGLVDELERLTRAGLSARAALLAATRDAARALRLDDQLGSIAVGMTADLLIVDGTPWEQVTALRNVRAVIQDGQRVVP